MRLLKSLRRPIKFSDGLVAILMRGSAAMAGFGVTLLVSRSFGPAVLGIYGLVTQTAMILSILVVGGMDFVVVRRFAAALGIGEKISRQMVLEVLQAALIPALIICALVGAAYSAFQGWEPLASFGLVAVVTLAILVASRALTRVTSAILRAYGQTFWSQFVEVLFIPLATIALILSGFASSLEALLWLTAAVSLLAAMLGVLLSIGGAAPRKQGLVPSDPSITSYLSMAREGFPLGAGAVALAFGDWYSLIAISAIGGAEAAGIYRVPAQLAMTVGIVTTGLTSAYAAKISAAHAREDRQSLEYTLREIKRLASVMSLFIAAPTIFFGGQILLLFGNEFGSSFPLLLVLVMAQIFSLQISNASVALAMTGHGQAHLPVVVISGLFLLIAVPIGALLGGIFGVASVVAIAQAGRAAGFVILSRKLIGVNALTGRFV